MKLNIDWSERVTQLRLWRYRKRLTHLYPQHLFKALCIYCPSCTPIHLLLWGTHRNRLSSALMTGQIVYEGQGQCLATFEYSTHISYINQNIWSYYVCTLYVLKPLIRLWWNFIQLILYSYILRDDLTTAWNFNPWGLTSRNALSGFQDSRYFKYNL